MKRRRYGIASSFAFMPVDILIAIPLAILSTNGTTISSYWLAARFSWKHRYIQKTVATPKGFVVAVHGPGEVTLTATQTGDDNYNAATPVAQTFVVAVITGSETRSESVFTISPNPGKGTYQITIPEEFDGGLYSMRSTDGSVKSDDTIELINGILYLDLTKNQAGLYLMSIWNENKRAILKIIKE